MTICAFQREEIFGTVVNGVMKLSPIGEIIICEWFRSAGIRKEILLYEDEFVVMPNHIHGIVWIIERNDVGANGVRPVDPPEGGASRGVRPTLEGTRRVPLRLAQRSLASFIAGFKSAVTSRVRRELNMANIWQRGYYEHIIRNETEFEKIWNYIDSNPLKWQEDQENPQFQKAE